jgi:cytochrome P450
MLLALSAARRGQYAELARLLNLWMLFRDAPPHTRLRKLMNKGFSPAVVESLRPRVESMVDRMLDALPSDSEVDLLGQVAHPLPVRVIAEMLGIADSKQEWLVRHSDTIAAYFGNPARKEEQVRAAQDALLELTEFFAKTVAERRKHKGSDLISLLLDIEEEGEVLTEEELHAQCIMLLFGGHETTRNLIGNGMYTLLRHPKEADELRQNPEMIRSAVEELLRYESPVQYTGRMALEELEICGVRLRRGEPIMFLLAAANRDPQRFEEPDRLNLKRANNPHLAFGAGAHFCIGNQLARLEGQVAILKLLQKFPRMRLAQPKMEWVPNLGLRGLKELRVVL